MKHTPPNPFFQSPCGQATLYHGDALAILPRIAVNCVHGIVTDPPYSSGGLFRGDRSQNAVNKYVTSDAQKKCNDFTGDQKDQRAYLAWSSLWLVLAEELAVPGAIACVFSDWRQLPVTCDAMQCGGWVWRGIVPWDKTNSRPMPDRFRNQCEYVLWGTKGPREFKEEKGRAYLPGILRGRPPTATARRHITQKPVGVMETLTGIVNPGETILDPFAGSGTTGVACVRTGRRFIGIEKNAHYCEVAAQRLEEELDSLK